MTYDEKINREFWLHVIWILIAVGATVFLVLSSNTEAEKSTTVPTQFYDTAVAGWMAPMYEEIEIEAEITYYTPRVQETDSDPYTMASGKRVYEGAIACPEWLDFGEEVYIDGQKYICEDRMAVKHRDKNKFDIMMFDLALALEQGVKVDTVKITNNLRER